MRHHLLSHCKQVGTMRSVADVSDAVLTDQEQVDCYVNAIPAFGGDALARLYGHINSSLPYLKTFKSLKNVSTYVTRNEEQITSVILFECANGRATVLNEGIQLEQAAVDQFARYVFWRFPDIDVIGFHHIETGLEKLSFPYQKHNQTENYVLPLPSTSDEYTAALGKATRRNIKRYMGKMMQDHPSFDCNFYTGAGIDRTHFTTLLRMSEAKILERKARFAINPEYAEGLWKLATQTGFVSLATIDGEICAGLICFQIGSYYFAHVVAHDGKYDAYWLGTLCYYLTVCEAIRRGGTVFNMGQLHYDYKERLLATKHDLDRIEIYRSYMTCISHLRCVAGMASGRRVRDLKLWLRRHPSSLLTRSIKLVNYRAHQLRSRG